MFFQQINLQIILFFSDLNIFMKKRNMNILFLKRAKL